MATSDKELCVIHKSYPTSFETITTEGQFYFFKTESPEHQDAELFTQTPNLREIPDV